MHNGIALIGENVPLNIYPKSQKKIDNNGRPEGKKGEINKIKPNSGGRYPAFFTNVGANAKGVKFHKISKLVHNNEWLGHCKLVNASQSF